MTDPVGVTGMVDSGEDTVTSPGGLGVKPGKGLRRTKGLSVDPAKARAWQQRSRGLGRGAPPARPNPAPTAGDDAGEHRPAVSASALEAAATRRNTSGDPAAAGAGMRVTAHKRDTAPIDKPKAEKTSGNEIPAKSRTVVAARSGGRCEAQILPACRRAEGRPAEHMHHRLLRRHGDHRPINLLHLCHGCHNAIHHDPDWAYDHGYLVRSWQRPDDIEIRWDLAPSADPRTRRRGTPR